MDKTMDMCRDLVNALSASREFPCENRIYPGGTACIRWFRDLTVKVKSGGRKRALWYDTDCRVARKLCPTCAALWHVMVAQSKLVGVRMRKQS